MVYQVSKAYKGYYQVSIEGFENSFTVEHLNGRWVLKDSSFYIVEFYTTKKEAVEVAKIMLAGAFNSY